MTSEMGQAQETVGNACSSLRNESPTNTSENHHQTVEADNNPNSSIIASASEPASNNPGDITSVATTDSNRRRSSRIIANEERRDIIDIANAQAAEIIARAERDAHDLLEGKKKPQIKVKGNMGSGTTIERKVKLVTEQKTIDKESPMENFPMKEWSVKVYMLDQDGNEKPAKCFVKATYNLHPSFERPSQTFTEHPFECKNEGWGEFEMSIDLYTAEKSGKHTVSHDLNFQKPRYEVIQVVNFKNPTQAVIEALRETGPIAVEDKKKKQQSRKAYPPSADIEKMADAMSRLDEEALIHVVQMIHDNKAETTFTKNDMENGEFAVDLYTLPDHLTKMIWDFLIEQNLVS